jgi:hypothetical protein
VYRSLLAPDFSEFAVGDVLNGGDDGELYFDEDEGASCNVGASSARAKSGS